MIHPQIFETVLNPKEVLHFGNVTDDDRRVIGFYKLNLSDLFFTKLNNSKMVMKPNMLKAFVIRALKIKSICLLTLCILGFSQLSCSQEKRNAFFPDGTKIPDWFTNV